MQITEQAILCTGKGEIQSTSTHSMTFLDTLLLSPSNQWLAQYMHTSNEQNIILDITNGTTLVACDGSFQHSHAIAAIIIENGDGRSCITTTVITPGGPKDMSAYRGELSGLYALIAIIN